MDFVYLILHYKTISSTEQTIDSISNLPDNYSRKIIIVDNGCNDSEYFKKKYPYADIIELKSNVGFSKANNIGYQYAKSNYSFKFIVVANNDVVFAQSYFEKLIIDEYKYSGFFILGPDVVNYITNGHQSPLSDTEFDYNEISRTIRFLKMKKKFVFIAVAEDFFRSTLQKFTDSHELTKYVRKLKKLAKIPTADFGTRLENPVFAGACLIFSEKYINLNEQLFFPEVFLYYEESFLALRCRRNNWLTVYEPSIRILHKHMISTKAGFGSKRDCLKFTTDNLLLSAKKYRDYLKETPDDFRLQ